jgi:hypothetical protein
MRVNSVYRFYLLISHYEMSLPLLSDKSDDMNDKVKLS